MVKMTLVTTECEDCGREVIQSAEEYEAGDLALCAKCLARLVEEEE